MKLRTLVGVVAILGALSACAVGRSETHNTSSLVDFLYPGSRTPPPQNAVPELRVPLRVGLAFLPSQASFGNNQLDAAHKAELLERIRRHFADRHFVSDLVVIPDYYLGANRGFAGLQGVQRLYDVDVMALVSYDQVTYTEDNRWSLGYLTIVGAYLVKGTVNDTTTLVDLAVVDPKTRSLVLRAGGTDTRHQNSTWVDTQHNERLAGSASFDAATNKMIANFDGALTAFENDVHAGRANVHVVSRSSPSGGGGSLSWEFVGLLALASLGRAAYSYTKT